MTASEKRASEGDTQADPGSEPKDNLLAKHAPPRARLSSTDRPMYLELWGERPRCILCEDKHTQAVEAHVYDKRSESDVAKIAPLCDNCNAAYNNSKRAGGPPLRPPRDPESVSNTARKHFLEGSFAAANTLYRLAAFLFRTRRNNRECELQSLSAAIAAIRPLGHAVLLKQTLSDVDKAYQALSPHSLLLWRAECLSQISLLLCDYGECLHSYLVQDKADKMRKSLVSSAWNMWPTAQEQDRLNQERRIVWTSCGVDRSLMSDPSKIDSYYADLVNNVEAYSKCDNFKGCVDNLGVHACRTILEHGPAANAVHEVASLAFDFATKDPNPWSMANHYVNEGRFQFLSWQHSKSRRDRSGAQDNLIRGVSLFQHHKIKPQPPPRDDLPPVDKMLEELGLSDWAWRAGTVLKPRGLFPLEWGFVKHVIDSASGSSQPTAQLITDAQIA